MQLSQRVQDLPLQGTEPQIKWGKPIRKKKISEVKKMSIKELALGCKPHLTEESLQRINCDTPEKVGKFIWIVAESMIDETSAQWWITHREDPIWQWIKPAVEKAIERCFVDKTFMK